MTLEEIEAGILKAHVEADKNLISHIIKPFCVRYHLDFISGMGTYVLLTHTGRSIETNYFNIRDINTKFHKRLRAMAWAIDTINDHTKFLGGGYRVKVIR